MLGKASLKLDWRHQVTAKSEEISIFATIFPMVSDLSATVAVRWLI
jgi:hypothetical protein